MKFCLVGLGALMLCTSVASHAAVNGDPSPAMVAGQFVDALQHQRFQDAAAMFAPGPGHNAGVTERTLQRVDDSLGGFSTIHPVATLPDGKSIKVEVPARKNVPGKVEKLIQVRYASTARDGQAVFYELNLTAGNMPSRVLSFGVHFPATDAQSTKRANQLVNAINR